MRRARLFVPAAVCFLLAASVGGAALAATDDAGQAEAAHFGVPGGLAVQVGGDDLSLPVDLAKTGRFLVQALAFDELATNTARERLLAARIYGLASADRLPGEGKLPFTENLVNLLIVAGQPARKVAAGELFRVMAPNGKFVAHPGLFKRDDLRAAGFDELRELEDGRLIARKPWPTEMDEWSHPRHLADGNAVSADTLVGPPRRVRWLAGPWHEVNTLVTAGGRNFYAGLVARDSFNGLRLWERDASPRAPRGGFTTKGAPGSALPVAGDGQLFAFSRNKLEALDGATGSPVREFKDAGTPHELLYEDGVVLSVDRLALRAFDAATGRKMWEWDAVDPDCVVAGDGMVAFVEGSGRLGSKAKPTAAALSLKEGSLLWQKKFPWLAAQGKWDVPVSRCVYHKGVLAYETSTLNDDAGGNGLHLVSAENGNTILDKPFLPGMNHRRQSRAMFIGNRLWFLHGGKDEEKNRVATKISGVDFLTGEVKDTFDAGLAHCFPPVATPKYIFSGELDLTDLSSGKVDANRITKAACGQENGWLPANGLIYLSPKHCVCWPMLRGYAALAPERPQGNSAVRSAEEERNDPAAAFPLERGSAAAPRLDVESDGDWPIYRHDPWRSGATRAKAPSKLEPQWTARFDDLAVAGPITEDWKENPFVNGPITAPVAARGLVYVARPDAHEVAAVDAATGDVRWRFIANGRVDTPPTIHRGLCLFGSKSGTVYCLRADDGRLVWKLRAAADDERIVAYGQIESPWPVPGSVLVVDDVAYFAAGRQSFADGGIRVFAVDPATGAIRWVERLDTVPQKGFYASSGLEFDNFDLLHQEGNTVAMSRWLFDRDTGKMAIDPWKAFARVDTGNGACLVPQGCWTYAPRHQSRTLTHEAKRPLIAFRDRTLFGCSEDRRTVYRRDFDLEGGEEFETKWITGWAASRGSRDKGEAWRSERLAKDAKWSAAVYDAEDDAATIEAFLLAGDRLLIAGSDGALRAISLDDGKELDRREIPNPLWDGLALANGRLYQSTADGRVLCLGE
ncbi:MAG: PQQ-binding-like beta-propeller repeat protein [Planctomycetaceae bacterium]